MTKIISVSSVELQIADGQWVWLGEGQLKVDPVEMTIVFDAPWAWPGPEMVEGAAGNVAEGFWVKLLDALGWRRWLERPLNCLLRWVGGQEDGHEG